MKKTILIAAAAAVLGAAAFVCGNTMRADRELSALQLENIEALSDNEASASSWVCWSQSESSSGGFWRCGSPCVWVDGEKGTKGNSKCYK